MTFFSLLKFISFRFFLTLFALSLAFRLARHLFHSLWIDFGLEVTQKIEVSFLKRPKLSRFEAALVS